MMWPFPKKHFEWREPKQFRQTLSVVEALSSRWWHKPLAGFIIASLLIVNWGLEKPNPNNRAPSFGVALALALPAGPFLVYFLSWFDQVVPSIVMVFDNRLFRTSGSSHREWKFKNMGSFAFHDCGAFHVLVLELKGGKQSLVGVPLEVDVRALESFLVGRGLHQIPPIKSLQMDCSHMDGQLLGE